MEMENSVASTIEKIKLQEQDKEVKLKEKREVDAAVVSISRNIRETTSQVEKSKQQQNTLLNNIDILRTQIMLAKIHRDALNNQLYAANKELQRMQSKSNEGISKVWEQRSSFCKEIHITSDNYDIWALLMKPTYIEPSVPSIKKEQGPNSVLDSEIRLQRALEKRKKASKERDLLKTEPDDGEEFLRIRNALRYSLEKIEDLRK